jgi:FkbM family methyltransferase
MATDVFVDQRFDGIYRRQPLVLADVGARGGLRNNWQVARRHLRVLGFEPEQREYDRLVEQTRVAGTPDTVFGVALHNRRGPLPLHVARDGGLTSMFEPNRAFLDAFPDASRFDIVGHQEIEADTLDHVLQAHAIADLDFIKADTQGSELFVLEGASRALESSVVGVEVEVEFAPIYQGQPLFADVDLFVRSLGYQLFDLRPCYWKRAAGRMAGGPYGQIIWADALYLKSIPALRVAIASLDADRRKAKILKALSVALVYGYADYAIEIASDQASLFSPEERATIGERLVAPYHRSGPRTFPGQRRVAGALRRLSKISQEPYDGWSVSDPDLGNLD